MTFAEYVKICEERGTRPRFAMAQGIQFLNADGSIKEIVVRKFAEALVALPRQDD